jgi:hypothetical protein
LLLANRMLPATGRILLLAPIFRGTLAVTNSSEGGYYA